jgi:dihydroorotase
MNSESSKSILIRNALLVNEGRIQEADMLIERGRISKIASSIMHAADIEIDAAGRCMLPGMIDDQVHFREPGLTHKGCMATESRAAVVGGITSFMDMPNTIPGTLTLEALAQKKAIAARSSVANYGFHFGVSNDNIDTIARLDPREVAGVKVFMGASTGNMLVDDPATLEWLFSVVPTILLAHCEHTPSINEQQAAYREHYERLQQPVPVACHPLIRNAEACYRSSSLAVELAKRYDTRLHVLHITTARELALFDKRPLSQKRITAEACIHQLYFCDDDYARLGNLIKCNPAIKTASDRAALRVAVNDGRIDVIGTDHAPHTLQEKSKAYIDAPAGLPLVQHALPALLQMVEQGVFDLSTVVAKTSHRVADLFQIKDRGYLREGYWADAVLIERMAKPLAVADEMVRYQCGWTPFAQEHFSHRVTTTIVSGQLAWHEGQILDACQGRALEFDRD